ncbi:MAG: HAD family phosphatase [Candidatus Omnitrophica bacterium]|nr:HAD family phosphatase [Candidatus Omnitrophota bacterium]
MAYPVVISDLGGVVLEFNADQVVHQMAQLLGRSFDEVQAAVYDKALLLPFELGRITPQAYYEGLTRSLKLPWTYEQFTRAWNNIFTENRDVIWIMERLRKRHRLIALTNTNALHIEHIKRSFPVLAFFEDWVASCDVGLRKPDPQIYALVLQRAGVRPADAVYIDDRPELVEAGKAAGLTVIRFQSSGQLEQELRASGFNI